MTRWKLPLKEFNFYVTQALSGDMKAFISELDEDDFEPALNIFNAVNLPLKDMIRQSGYTQAKFSDQFLIPKRTVEDWCSGKRQPAIYLRLLIAEKLGVLKVRKID